jgi:hypothetical protein
VSSPPGWTAGYNRSGRSQCVGNKIVVIIENENPVESLLRIGVKVSIVF